MTIRDILRRYPVGTILEVWQEDWGGPCHIGLWQVGKRTIVHLEFGRPTLTWGQFRKEFRIANGYEPGRIVKVRPFSEEEEK